MVKMEIRRSSLFDRPPEVLPEIVYRVTYPSSQTSYNQAEGFRSKNQHTIVNTTQDIRFYGNAHLNWATNVSSPFISVFADKEHAKTWARCHSMRNDGEVCYVVEVNTKFLGRGPPFRAAHIFEMGVEQTLDESQHYSEYLIMYRIPLEAIMNEEKVQAIPECLHYGGYGTFGTFGTYGQSSPAFCVNEREIARRMGLVSLWSK